MDIRFRCAVFTLIATFGAVGVGAGQTKAPAPVPKGLPSTGAGDSSGAKPVPRVGAVAVGPSSSDVTFTIPLNLTNLSPLISKVAVNCTITSTALPQAPKPGAEGSVSTQQEYPVTSGRVVTTATIVVPVTAVDTTQPNGKKADYFCKLMLYSERLKTWSGSGVDAVKEYEVTPEFRLRPGTGDVGGTFNW